jgi:hypothetical protein
MKKYIIKESEDFELKFKEYSEKIKKLTPIIKKMYEVRFKDNLIKVEVSSKLVNYASNSFTGRATVISLYFDDKFNNLMKQEVYRMIRDNFDIPLFEYGVPLSIETYRLKWERY